MLTSLTDWPVPAVSAAVIVDGPDVAARHGDRDRVQELASVTKLLVAYASLVAVEEGAVELDEAAGPEGSTVRHLLAHTSGVAFDDRRPTTAPGTKRIYSSAGFEILAEHVTERSGIEFGEYLSGAVLEPLGMTSTELHGSAGHGARSNLRDMEAFAAELLEPTLVSRQTVDEATTVQFEGLGGILPGYGSQRPNDWGLGFELRDHKAPHWTGETNSARTFGHFGQSGTFLWVDPDARVSCVVLADRAFGDWAKPLWTALGDAVLAGV
ncbi:beta-lactamase family protein [Rhodococcus sp. BP-349]|nr:beta-lactamase family protein [Rhodococcus sp. BP-363]MBY6545337.1 beta-lactamase family protein [Rhodococcus sp. BP-369]MBY6564567.1 beta-lactamase family protein [Rhodococcus sp. BP-370]MBY6578497.1 beta-lactamase family protein [Rhodococcus sp. BP-364]MBY6587798.1 beta-lactamase family protein [Rhodococcus sp. BP-358]MBY6592135.1 beta-lactamase family protein [Rhodococcus sp. BP-362]MBY6596834.1 beta-lactamase family protein [Rhodococcus sp. BP-359]MBY6601173.1 beta-lactamase family pr